MKVMAFNGSPRKKKWNTVTLLNNALQGAQSTGAETELVQLYDLKFSGCISCFSCKRLSRKKDGVCSVQDDLTPVLDRVKQADALIIGSPVYYGAESAATRAFLERLCFPYLKYSKDGRSLFPRRINTAMIYTMNAPDQILQRIGYDRMFAMTQMTLGMHISAHASCFYHPTLCSTAITTSTRRRLLIRTQSGSVIPKSSPTIAHEPLR